METSFLESGRLREKTMGQLSKKENKIFFFLIFMSLLLGFRTYNKSTQNHIVSCSAAATTKFVSFLVKEAGGGRVAGQLPTTVFVKRKSLKVK